MVLRTSPNRSRLVEAIISGRQRAQVPQVRSGAELAARTGSSLIDALLQRDLIKAENTREAKTAEAFSQALGGGNISGLAQNPDLALAVMGLRGQEADRASRAALAQQRANLPLSTAGNIRADEGAGRISAADAERALTKSPAVSVNLQDGKAPLQKPVVRKLQDELIGLEDQFQRVNSIGERFDPEFLTFGGKAGAFISGLKNKANIDLTPEERKFVKDRKQFEFLVSREFNSYRRDITGAAASVQELESLKDAALNTDLSPIEFEAAFDIYRNELKRGLRLKRRILRDGLTVGNERFGDRFDGLYLAGQDDDADLRLQELVQSGLTQEQAIDRLIAEGFE